MQILDNLIILILPVLAFIAGKKVSDHYNESIVAELQYQLRLELAKHGVGYVAPPARRNRIGTDFMDKLKENGKAVQKINNP